MNTATCARSSGSSAVACRAAGSMVSTIPPPRRRNRPRPRVGRANSGHRAREAEVEVVAIVAEAGGNAAVAVAAAVVASAGRGAGGRRRASTGRFDPTFVRGFPCIREGGDNRSACFFARIVSPSQWGWQIGLRHDRLRSSRPVDGKTAAPEGGESPGMRFSLSPPVGSGSGERWALESS